MSHPQQMIIDGFLTETRCAFRAARQGMAGSMGRHLAAAHALAMYGAPELLKDYPEAEQRAWQEYETWKTTQG